MKYIDGYILPVPKKNLPAYKKMAQLGAKLWKKQGALGYYEAVGDDLDSMLAGIRFPATVKAKRDEVIVSSFIVFKSRAHRDRVNEKVWKDPAMNEDKPIPFDVKRMVYGGFKTLVEK